MADEAFAYMNEKSLDPELECSICSGIFVDPCRTLCKHTFCRECITKWLERRKECPSCRRSAKLDDLRTDRSIAAVIDRLPVICNRCGYSGIFRKRFDDHIKKYCSKLRCNSSRKTNNNDELDPDEQIDSAINEILTAETYYDTLKNHLNAMNERLNNQQKEIEILKQSNLTHRHKIQELQLSAQAQCQKIDEQNDLIIELNRRLLCASNDTESRIVNFEEEITHNLEHIKHQLETQINKLIQCRDDHLEDYIEENCPFRSELNLSHLNLYDNHMETIVRKGILNRQVSSLDLSENHLTCQGVFILSAGFHLNIRLTKLDLSYNDIHDQAIRDLAEALLGNTTLIDLRLGATKLTNQGIKYLIQMLRFNQTLEKLHLHDNDFDDDGMKLLTNVLHKQNQTLNELVLHSNRLITDRSFNAIIDMWKENPLELIDLQRCQFSPDIKSRLRDAAKNARIHLKIESTYS